MGKEKNPVEPHSKMTNGRLSGLFCWPQWQDENSSARRHSKMTKCWMGIMRVMGSMRIMGWKTKIENSPAQLHSKFSRLVWFVKNMSAQWHSKFSNGRLSGLFCWPQGQGKNNPAQQDSRISKWISCPLSPLCLFSPLVPKNMSAQGHSKFSKSGMGRMGLIGHTGLIGITPAVE
jgi:hypothetical protein